MRNYWSFCLLLLIIPALADAQAVGTWSDTGPVLFPTNVSGQVNGMGRVSQVKFHATNPAKVYAVSASGGLYISSDTGNTWAPTPGTDIMATTPCSSVCIDYTNDNVIYLSTGDQNYYGDSYGIYKSTNAGLTWTAVTTGIGTRMAVEILMDPTNHNALVAATTDGIWKTTNGGTSWTETYSGEAFKSMKQKPGTNRTLYASTGLAFYRSFDFGSTWTNITSGVTVPAANEGIRIAVTPADTNIVVLGTTGGYGEILKSTDGGTTFTNIYTSSTQCVVCYDSTVTSGSQGYYNFNLTINPANANEMLLVSHCVWRSTDGGLTWSWRTQWWNQVHTDMHDIEFDPYNLSMRFNANDGGVWMSRDTLATYWVPRSTGLAATEMYHAAQCPVNRQLDAAGTQDNGELFYDGVWKCNRGGDWSARCGMDYLGRGTVYYDNGNRRDLTPLGGDYSYNAPFVTTPGFAIEFLPSMHNTAFLATDSIWRSDNINSTTPTWNLLTVMSDNAIGMASCRADSNILYIVTDGNRILRSDNALAAAPAFSTYSTPVSTSVMASVATDKHNANIVYLSCNNKLYRSANKGISWTDITYALPNLNIKKVIADDYSATERLFVSIGSYVYYKDNTTTTWTLTNGLPTIAGITDFMIYNDSTSASILRLSTYGRGMWECNIQNNLPPSGSFTATKQTLCPGDTVTYHKLTYGNISSFHWSFPGGIPAASTADSPVVVYPAAGTYNASLSLSGTYGNDTITRPGYIVVSNGGTAAVTEGFEGAVYPPAQWTQQSQSGNNWQLTSTTGGYGASSHCMMFDNFDNDAGGRHDRILTPKLNLGYASNVWLKFDVAYSYYPGYRDTLIVDVSSDCGRTFTPVYIKDTTNLATAPDTTGFFLPTATEWRTDSISLNAYIGTSILVAFDNVGHYGQGIYIDNVNISFNLPPAAVPVAPVNETIINIYPNPATDYVSVTCFGMPGNWVTVSCYSVMGKLVATREEFIFNGQVNSNLELGKLPRGIYEIVLKDELGIKYVRKVLLQ